jgi:hypothetical protein
MKRYELSVTKPEYWNKIHNALIVDSNQDGIPDRQVTCTDSKEHSPTRGTYELTEEEAAEIAAHPYVKWIELSPIDNPDAYPKPDFATKRFKKNVKFYRDVLSSGIPATNPTSAELDRSNWGVGRASVRKSGTFFSDNSNTVTVEERDVSYQLTGRNIDIIVHDSGVLQYHPEFMDANGQSRVRDIILDGPYYIDPDYFNIDTEYNNGGISSVTGDGSDFFKREVTTNGVRIMGAGTVGGQTAVPDAWLEKVARMFELFFDKNASGINETAQRTVIKTLRGDSGTYHAGLPTLQRVARGAGADYTPNFLTDQGIIDWNLTDLFDTHVQNDMVWYLNSTGSGYGDGDLDAQEVIEHVFHTIHMHGLPADDIKLYSYLASDWQSGDLYAAMEEAYDAGKWDPSGYQPPGSPDEWKTDADAFEVAAKEYLYLLNFCMFEYTSLWDGGSLSPEWTDDMRTQAGIQANNPLGYAFHNTYIAPVISKPSLTTIRSIFQDGNTPEQDDPSLAGASGYVVDVDLTYTRADGRVTGQESASRDWWTNSSNRSAQFQSEGTISVSSLYTEARSMGASLDGANSLTDGHGTACASLIAGKNFGHAFEANIWNMPGIGDAVGMDIETNYDAMKIWIRNRPVNSTTKRKNPVIINGSWGYTAAFASSSTVSYQYKGSTGTFTGNDAAVADTITALKEGIYTSRYATQYRSWATSSRSSATDTAANEMMLEGPIYVAAAGNDNLYLGKGANDPHRLNYMSDTYFGTTDPRSEFPSGTVPCSHRDWMNPQGIGFDETKDFHPVVCVGALEDTVTTGGAEYQAPYSNNGPGIDVWAPADETLAAGGVFSNGGYNNYERYDDSRFYDASFSGTSAAAPVACGVIALYLEGNPNADSRAVQNWIRDNGTLLGITTSSTVGEGFFSQYDDTTDVNYWTGDYNLRGADPRVIYSPYATEEVPVIDPGTEKIIQDELVLELDGHNHTTDANRWYNSAKDSSHVTLSSGITYDGYGYVFSDFNQGSFTKNSDFEFISDFTFESWFYMTQQPGSVYPSALFSSWSTVNNVNNKFIFYLNSSYKFVYELDNGNSYGGIGLVMSDTVSLNTWNHVVVTRSGSDISCYLNNVKDATVQTYSSTITPTLNDIRIGDYAGTVADSFTGTIGMIRFYRRSFSDNDVKQHYDEQVGRFDGSLRPSLMLDGISFSYE